MVYTKDKVADALHAALLSSPAPSVKAILEAERTRQDLPADKGANQDGAFNYLIAIQNNAAFVPDFNLLNTHLAWVAKHRSTLDGPTLANLTNIIRNVVGGAAYAANVRNRLQDFKRLQLQDYSDSDPIEATVFAALNKLSAAADDPSVKDALATISGLDYLIPVVVPGAK